MRIPVSLSRVFFSTSFGPGLVNRLDEVDSPLAKSDFIRNALKDAASYMIAHGHFTALRQLAEKLPPLGSGRGIVDRALQDSLSEIVRENAFPDFLAAYKGEEEKLEEILRFRIQDILTDPQGHYNLPKLYEALDGFPKVKRHLLSDFPKAQLKIIKNDPDGLRTIFNFEYLLHRNPESVRFYSPELLQEIRSHFKGKKWEERFERFLVHTGLDKTIPAAPVNTPEGLSSGPR